MGSLYNAYSVRVQGLKRGLGFTAPGFFGFEGAFTEFLQGFKV